LYLIFPFDLIPYEIHVLNLTIMFINLKNTLFAVCFLLFCGNNKINAVIKLPAIFSHGMVLQQKSSVNLWGWADPGEKILIASSWANSKSITTTADASGKWKTQLQTPGAGGPYTITFKGKNSIEIKDVLLGEVWVCSGQSNMVFSLKGAYHATEEIAAANFPSIRYFSVKRQYGSEEFDDCQGSEWVKTSPQTAGGFSAVAYFFAKKIYEELHVPVGLVYAAWGGTPAEAWTPASAFQNDHVLQVYIERWKKMLVTVGEDSTVYHKALDEWEQKRKTADSNTIKKPQEPATLVWYNRLYREPSALFNGMINPVIPYSIKGVLWYQGESNVNFAEEYFHLFSTLIQSWREKWHNNMPFYFVQIAPFNYSNLDAAAQLQWAQSEVAAKVSNTGMAATVDVGNMKDQHPVHKKEVGDRLAFIALHHLYGKKNLVFAGPQVTNATLKNNKVFLQFDQNVVASQSSSSNAFEVGYKNEKDSVMFLPAQAIVNGSVVTVWNESVTTPVAVRYAWLRIANADLSGKERLPVTPFIKTITK